MAHTVPERCKARSSAPPFDRDRRHHPTKPAATKARFAVARGA